MSEITHKYLKEKFTHPWFRFFREIEKGSEIIWVLLRDFKFFGVHFQTAEYYEMPDTYQDECLKMRLLDDKIYYLPIKYDIPYKIYEFVHSPHKVWHKEFLKDHKDEIDPKIIRNAFGSTYMFKKALKLIKSLDSE